MTCLTAARDGLSSDRPLTAADGRKSAEWTTLGYGQERWQGQTSPLHERPPHCRCQQAGSAPQQMVRAHPGCPAPAANPACTPGGTTTPAASRSLVPNPPAGATGRATGAPVQRAAVPHRRPARPARRPPSLLILGVPAWRTNQTCDRTLRLWVEVPDGRWWRVNPGLVHPVRGGPGCRRGLAMPATAYR